MQIISHQNIGEIVSKGVAVVFAPFENLNMIIICALSSTRKSQRFFDMRTLLPLSSIVAWFFTDPHMYESP